MSAAAPVVPSISSEVRASCSKFWHNHKFETMLQVISGLAASALMIIAFMGIKGSISDLSTLAPTVIALSGLSFLTSIAGGRFKGQKEAFIITALFVSVVITLGVLGVLGFVTFKHISIGYLCGILGTVVLPCIVCLIHAHRQCS